MQLVALKELSSPSERYSSSGAQAIQEWCQRAPGTEGLCKGGSLKVLLIPRVFVSSSSPQQLSLGFPIIWTEFLAEIQPRQTPFPQEASGGPDTPETWARKTT